LIAAILVIAYLLIQHGRYRAIHKWSDDDVTSARRESVNRSRSVVVGKVQEHLAPLSPEFFGRFNPKDARFLGSPVDFVVFDGLDEGFVRNVCLIEVKTGRAGMTPRERLVRDAVNDGRVIFEVVKFTGTAEFDWPLPEPELVEPLLPASPVTPPVLQT
jgi:predicted Holliday junction resolvase-like endonuclease